MPPRESGGAVASLAVYQMQSLRDKNAELERRLAELVEIAAENEKLMERVHALTVALLRASTMEVTARTVIARLSADFHTERVRLLFDTEPKLPRADWLEQVAGGAAALPEFAEFLHKGEPSSEWPVDRQVGPAVRRARSRLAVGGADAAGRRRHPGHRQRRSEPLPAGHGHAVPEDGNCRHHHRRAGALAGCLLSRR
ncbi:hypothetical protein RLIN73S_06072 [Rhodanobacter lindaniclasticus]